MKQRYYDTNKLEPLENKKYVFLLEDEYEKMQSIINAIKSDYVITFKEMWCLMTIYNKLGGVNGKLEIYDKDTFKVTIDRYPVTDLQFLFIDRKLLMDYYPDMDKFINEVL